MKPSVKSYFRKFNEPLEGVVPWMYLDVKGLVTTGVGNLIDPISEALVLPWQHKDNGEIATRGQIAQEWNWVKANKDLARLGHREAEKHTALILPDKAIDALIESRLLANEATLRKWEALKDWDAFPADAQLGILSMTWAVGAGGLAKFPRFLSHCKAMDFQSAADECAISTDDNAGIVPRNKRNVSLFWNAAFVIKSGLDRDDLYYPNGFPLEIERTLT